MRYGHVGGRIPCGRNCIRKIAALVGVKWFTVGRIIRKYIKNDFEIEHYKPEKNRKIFPEEFEEYIISKECL